MWIGVLWAGLRVAMWITHVGGKYRHGLLEKSLIKNARFESLASLRFETAIRNARFAIRFKHSNTAKLQKGLRFESAIQNR